MAYATWEEIQAHKGFDNDEAGALLVGTDGEGGLLADAAFMFEQETGRDFQVSTDGTRYFDAVRNVDGRVLRFDRDICSITSITNGDAVAVDSDDYVTEPRNDTPYYAVRLLASSSVRWSYTDDVENAITVVGKWGYSATPPRDVKRAVIDLALWLYNRIENPTEVDTAKVAQGMILLPSGSPLHVQQMVRRYRNTL